MTRAARGATLLAARSVVIRIIGLAGNVVLARMLVPEEFGLLALGLTLTTIVGLFSTVGLGAGIIRRPEPPDTLDLQTVMTTSLLASALFVPAVGLLVPVFGEAVAIATLMVIALPIQTLRTPDGIMLERNLSYGPVAKVEIVETLVATILSVALVVCGAGIWGVAAVAPVRAAVGTVVMWRIGPVGPLKLGFSRARASALLGEGATFAAQDVIGLIRDQGTNFLITYSGGLAALGAWSLQSRLMTIPLVVLSSLWQVAFPAMSRAGGMSADPDEQIKRALRLTAVGLGLPAAVLIGTSQSLVPVLFGPGWDDVAATLPFSVAAILLSGPTSVALGSKLFAEKRGKVVVASAVAHTIVLLALIVSLYPALGLVAVGVATLAAGMVEVVVFSSAVRGDSLGFLLAAARPVSTAGLGAGAGLVIAHWGSGDIASLIIEATISGSTAMLATAALARPAWADFFGTLRSALKRS